MLKWFPYRQKPFWNRIGTFVKYATKGSKGIRIFKCTAAATRCRGSYSRERRRRRQSRKRCSFVLNPLVSTMTLAMPLVTSSVSKNTSGESIAIKSIGFVTNAPRLMLFILISKLISKLVALVATLVIVAVSFLGPLSLSL